MRLFCRIHLENWEDNRLTGWEKSEDTEGGVQFSHEVIDSPAGVGKALLTRAIGSGKEDCRMVSLRKVFTVHRASDHSAFLYAYLIFDAGVGRVNFPHIEVELLDDAQQTVTAATDETGDS